MRLAWCPAKRASLGVASRRIQFTVTRSARRARENRQDVVHGLLGHALHSRCKGGLASFELGAAAPRPDPHRAGSVPHCMMSPCEFAGKERYLRPTRTIHRSLPPKYLRIGCHSSRHGRPRAFSSPSSITSNSTRRYQYYLHGMRYLALTLFRWHRLLKSRGGCWW